MNIDITQEIIDSCWQHEEKCFDTRFACLSKTAMRRKEEHSDKYAGLRNPFAHDVDRIIHCHAFARYMDKTQVFFQIKNDHISRRSLHVQMVSRIARTIGRCLHLNEDLIEAIAIGHDIGHTPFGHAGETCLADILQERKIGHFVHNAQSVRILQYLEKQGAGLNLTLQVLDGILGHNGELESKEYHYDPAKLTWETLEKNLNGCLSEEDFDKHVFPSTLEGCVVRVSDIIAYLGKDFDDAVALNLITPEDLPFSVSRILGSTNREIIASFCNDIIINSYNKGYLAFSDAAFGALLEFKKFNYERIYGCDLISYQREKFTKMVRDLFEIYLLDIRENRTDMDIFKHFIVHHRGQYFKEEPPERMVADYIAGMTDQYFLKQYELRFVPQVIDYNALEIVSNFRIKH